MEGVVDIFGDDEADERPRLEELDNEINLVPAFKGMHEHAFLELMAAEALEVMAQCIPNPAAFFWNIEKDHPPFPIPCLGRFDFYVIELIG